ncbi:hypothetical protein ACJJIF_02435 [Microbulbifer sp. SSSA002]|uniref:hypothetical protein n=1 Tax=unclassified Microbulbifer TaxID=2619833 RepID=UPI00403974C5
MKKIKLMLAALSLTGCAQGHIDILKQDGEVIGSCSAEFYLHWHGAQDSVNYILNLCAQEAMARGLKISDESILANDYTLPESPQGYNWSKKLAKEYFSNRQITEEKLGYILAAIELDYQAKLDSAQERKSRSEITQIEYEKLISEAKQTFEGE